MTEKTKSEKDYNVNLPETSFPMKANSAVRDVEIQRRWQELKVYEKSLEKRANCDKFVLHDGPPYLSSSKIHIGTALNKILKDIVTKYKSQKGFYSPYVPGYDSHGLPIENAVLKDVKGGRHAMSPVELRKRCREFALGNLKGQEANFIRLGVWGDWEHPYITLDPKFEAAQIRVFGKMATRGFLYKGLKSVSWCPNCETALAEAEVEYQDHSSHSIYVKFEVNEESRSRLPFFAQGEYQVSFVIWTTTPWTLPANLGVALNPEFTYHFIETREHGVLIVAEPLKDAFLETLGFKDGDTNTIGTASGKELEHIKTSHPFIDRTSLVVLGAHVTADAGTGCVHTAPGHGPEDFELGMKYKLGVVSPVDERGVFTEEAGIFKGQRYDKANQPIVDHLQGLGKLLHHSTYSHSYPHCWRCKKPLIFRATEQWFASVDGFRKEALAAIDTVKWIPESGRNRIYNMVENRSDWCISRQRAWGVPIPVFYCKSCKKPLMTAESIGKVADVFEREGSDAWWEKDAKQLLGELAKCTECGSKELEKETDIMDVWFDSGTTHYGVIDQRPELKGTPCELYLEGSDQHRGWFQSSLLTSVAVNNRAPYKTVLTHGFVVDETGRKMSKSLGNVVEPEEVIKQCGADVLRLWVASVNYTDDIPIGKNMLAQLAEVYRKLRNTARYLLGTLNDFDPATDALPYEQLNNLDQFILHRLNDLVEEVIKDFDRFEFFKYYQLLQNFCVVDLSSFYFDILKDRLYTSAKNSATRRAAQTVLEEILNVLVRLLVPVTPHLAEDIFEHIPQPIKTFRGFGESVLLTDFPAPSARYINSKLSAFWEDLIDVRSTVNKALEQARAQRKIRSSLEAKVVLAIENQELREKVMSLGENLPGFFITSQAGVEETPNGKYAEGKLSEVSESGITVLVLSAEGSKCPRCRKFSTSVGKDREEPELCDPCVEALKQQSSV
ncbi:MAG TPA: isoleucine--tRNA ligase [Candidatus Obscuribacterales bacterium]